MARRVNWQYTPPPMLWWQPAHLDAYEVHVPAQLVVPAVEVSHLPLAARVVLGASARVAPLQLILRSQRTCSSTHWVQEGRGAGRQLLHHARSVLVGAVPATSGRGRGPRAARSFEPWAAAPPPLPCFNAVAWPPPHLERADQVANALVIHAVQVHCHRAAGCRAVDELQCKQGRGRALGCRRKWEGALHGWRSVTAACAAQPCCRCQGAQV